MAERSYQHASVPVIVIGGSLTLIAALSVHAVMIQGLNIPFPANFPHSGWARFPDTSLSVFGAICLSRHLPQSLRDCSLFRRFLFLFLILAAMHGVLFRAPFMEFINLSNFTLWPFLDNVPNLLPWAFIAIGVELFARRRSSLLADVLYALLLGALAAIAVLPASDHAFAGVIRFTQAREGQQRFGLPYDWHILVPAYATFVEPVVAALVVGFAVRRQLPSGTRKRVILTAALIFAIRGPLFAPILNVHFAQSSAMTAMLSYAQFTFEGIALAILAAFTVQMAYLRPGRAEDRPAAA